MELCHRFRTDDWGSVFHLQEIANKGDNDDEDD